MASHEELLAELPKLEKLSHAARLKRAKKRREEQLKKYRATLVSMIKKKKAPAVIKFELNTLLYDLVTRNDVKGVSKVLEKGADPNITNADGLTPLHKCCIDNSLAMAEVILEHGVDLNARDIEGWTALHAAAATGNIRMINLLIDEGASLVAINNDDKMPVDVAADGDITYVLQQKMIEAGYTDDMLEYIRASVAKTMLADLKDSVKNNRSLNIKDKYGTAALHVAAANGYAEVMDFLLSNEDVDLDIPDNEGWTPFHAAACWNQSEMMKKLAEKGANMDLKNSRGESAFIIAEEPEVKQLVLELKGQYSPEIIDMPEIKTNTVRRLSVNRSSQREKRAVTKQSTIEEASIMAEHDLDDLAKTESFDTTSGTKDEEISKTLDIKEDEENESTSVANKASEPSPEAATPPDEPDNPKEETNELVEDTDETISHPLEEDSVTSETIIREKNGIHKKTKSILRPSSHPNIIRANSEPEANIPPSPTPTSPTVTTEAAAATATAAAAAAAVRAPRPAPTQGKSGKSDGCCIIL